MSCWCYLLIFWYCKRSSISQTVYDFFIQNSLNLYWLILGGHDVFLHLIGFELALSSWKYSYIGACFYCFFLLKLGFFILLCTDLFESGHLQLIFTDYPRFSFTPPHSLYAYPKSGAWNSMIVTFILYLYC